MAITNYIDNMCNDFSNTRMSIFGDFNYPNIKRYWSGRTPTAHENADTLFLECQMSNNLEQIINLPTRDNKTLDLILCKNENNNNMSASILPPLISTDHEHIKASFEYTTKINSTSPDESKILNYNYAQADYNSINNFLSNTNWYIYFSECYKVKNIWSAVMSKIRESIDLYETRRK